jgi:phage repressor protein C with HTH and peptisase S24 domain
MTNEYMCEISHGQALACGIFRASRLGGLPCDISGMGNSLNIQAIRDTINREMEAKGFSRRKLSLTAGLSVSSVRDLLERTENPGIGTLRKVAEALDLPFEAISGTERVPLMGKIGAGGAIAFFEATQPEFVPRPPLAPGPLMALEVAGESMLPKYDPGDIVYIRRDHDGVLPRYIGEYCAVHLADGGTYLKILAEGSQPDRYTLRSLNAADMPNVEVIWAAPVLFIMPRRSR